MRFLFNLLRLSSLASVDVDTEKRLHHHREILMKKPMLQEVFMEFNQEFKKLTNRFFPPHGIEIELGAGVAPMRDTYPEVLATDIMPSLHLDRVLDAEHMDLTDNSVRVFYAQNCFHHFPHPDHFFTELERTLVPGGGAIILDPYYGPVASLVYKQLHKTEGYDKTYPDWETPMTGPMNGANQALSYIVFVRDCAEFERKHPNLKIIHSQRVGNYLRYIISGGLNFHQLLPDCAIGLLKIIEKILSPFNRWLAIMHIIVIKKI